MTDRAERISTLRAELAELEAEAEETIEEGVEAAEEAVTESAEPVEEAVEEVKEEVQEAAAEVATEAGHPELAGQIAEELMARLEAKHPHVFRGAHEEHVADVVEGEAEPIEEAHEEAELVEPVPVAEEATVEVEPAPEVVEEHHTTTVHHGDSIAPRRDHFFTRPRRVFGRTWG